MISWLSLMLCHLSFQLCLEFAMGAIANNTAMNQLELRNFELSVIGEVFGKVVS
jgi:hypothetical protein